MLHFYCNYRQWRKSGNLMLTSQFRPWRSSVDQFIQMRANRFYLPLLISLIAPSSVKIFALAPFRVRRLVASLIRPVIRMSSAQLSTGGGVDNSKGRRRKRDGSALEDASAPSNSGRLSSTIANALASNGAPLAATTAPRVQTTLAASNPSTAPHNTPRQSGNRNVARTAPDSRPIIAPPRPVIAQPRPVSQDGGAGAGAATGTMPVHHRVVQSNVQSRPVHSAPSSQQHAPAPRPQSGVFQSATDADGNTAEKKRRQRNRSRGGKSTNSAGDGKISSAEVPSVPAVASEGSLASATSVNPRPLQRPRHIPPPPAQKGTAAPVADVMVIDDDKSSEGPQKSGGRLKHTSDKEFQSLAISEASKRALAEVFKYQFMTLVQAETLPVILEGRDCLAKAKTGTGKTLAFLIPAIEKLPAWRSTETQRHIPILILSPNRELAAQIGQEAEQLLRFHPNKRVACVVGGTNINSEKNNLDRGNIAVLVATPGRLIDHFESTRGFQQAFSKISTFVLDEADQLLDMGFKPALDRILGFLPPSSLRQTLLFSATVPPAVKQIADVFLRPGYSKVDTVGEETEQTHLHVKQHLAAVSTDDMNAALLSLLIQHMQTPNFKILVFFTTARMAGFEADLFETLRLPVLQIHSRMSQNARTRTSDQFRVGTNIILFSSDVSARGLDYPDVTFVLQVGFTEKSQYIHRLGRTARA
ncbi:DEAD/DEAH box helicase, partial [archaeon]